MGIPPRRNGGSCSDGFGPHYELRGRGNHDDSNFGWVIISSPRHPRPKNAGTHTVQRIRSHEFNRNLEHHHHHHHHHQHQR